MAAPQVKQYGITPPIQTQLPTKQERDANDALMEELKQQNNFESPEDTEKRKKVLQLIQTVIIEFVKLVSKKRKLPQATIDSAGGKIFTFGSYRLGVYGPGEFEKHIYIAIYC